MPPAIIGISDSLRGAPPLRGSLPLRRGAEFRGCLSDGKLQNMTIQESGECYMTRRKLIDLSRAKEILEKFCEKEHRQHRAIRLRRLPDLLPQVFQFEKLEIHTVSLRFSNFNLSQNLSAIALVSLRGAA